MNNCGTCAHSNQTGEHKRLYALGLHSCARLPAWHFVQPMLSCRATPIQWKAAR